MLLRFRAALFFLSWLPFFVFSQQHPTAAAADSLWAVWDNPRLPPVKRVEALLAYFPLAPVANQADSMHLLAGKAVAVAIKAGDPPLLARVLSQQGKALFALTRFQESIPIFRRALATAQQTQDTALIGAALTDLGSAKYEVGQVDSAELLLVQALRLAPKNSQNAALALSSLGNLYSDEGRYDEAIDVGRRALSLFKQFGDSAMMAKALGNLANPMIYTNQYDSALWYTQQAIKIHEALGDQAGEAVAYATLGNISMLKGDTEAALKDHELARKKYEATGQSQYVALCLANMGSIYIQMGDYQRALGHLEAASQIFEAQQNPSYQSFCLMGIGDVYFSLEAYDQAIEQYQAALALREAIDQSYGVSELLGRIGTVYRSQGKWDEALAAHQREQAMSTRIGDQKGLARSLANFGSLYKAQGDEAQALFYFEESLSLQQAISSEQMMGTVLLDMAEIYCARGQMKQAEAAAQRGLAISQAFFDLRSQNGFAKVLYQAYKALGQTSSALAMHELHVALQDSLDREENQEAILGYEYRQKTLTDSLRTLQQIKDTELAYQACLTQRNYVIAGAWLLLALGALGFLFFRNQQRIKQREQALSFQQERAEREQLRQLDQLKNRFFTNITHEFRTPLTVISGMAQILTGNPREKKLILRNSQNLLRLINQLLDLARLEAGQLHVHLTQAEVVSYVRYLTESFYSMAEEKDIRLTFYAEEREVWMDIDEEKLQYVIFNLLSNALKFTSVGGKVILHLKRNDDRLEIKVQDSGMGIAPAQLPYIFDRFYQADDSSTRAYEGTGIGLAYTRELVQQLGGKVEVESEVKVGSIFRLWLPIRQQAPKAVPQVTPLPSTLLDQTSFAPEAWDSEAQPEVLIVEDNPDLIFYLQSVLVSHYALKVARNGEEGIRMALETIPDLIVSDVIMPHKDGFELCETLKTDQRTSHIPIILLTAKAAQADRIEGLTRGADGYMAKPFDKEELLVRVEKLIALRRSLQLTYAKEVGPTSPDAPQLPEPEHDFLQQLRAGLTPVLADSEFTIPQVAAFMGMSQIQVYRKLKALTGQTPSQFLRQLRLDTSKSLLANPELTIAEVAYEVGFSDPNYFSKTFHQTFGIPPSEFRKRL
jgi:signal transduction histidine kinase/AraC-like DNA-binding protein/predicted negative regulator of RcsB-dependent stress response